jgi:hypothetical protein
LNDQPRSLQTKLEAELEIVEAKLAQMRAAAKSKSADAQIEYNRASSSWRRNWHGQGASTNRRRHGRDLGEHEGGHGIGVALDQRLGEGSLRGFAGSAET